MKIGASSSTELTAEDRARFRKFRIPDALLKEAKVYRLGDQSAHSRGFYCRAAAHPLAGVVFPYLDVQGQEFNARIRRDECEAKEDGSPENKYLSLPKDKGRRGLNLLPVDRRRLVAEKNLEVILVESEKSKLAGMAWARRMQQKHLIFAATGGCRSYHTSDLELLRGHQVTIQWDANVWTNPDVRSAESEAARLMLVEYGLDVAVRRLPRKSLDENINGLDDFIAHNDDSKVAALFRGQRSEPWLDAVGVTWEEYCNTKPPLMVVDRILQEGGVTMLGGLPSAMKSWVMLSMVKALLTGERLFGHFPVAAGCVKRVIYLTPEVGRPSFIARLKLLELGKFVESRQLLFRTLSETRIELRDANLLLSAPGSVIFLDTVIRFIEGPENENKANDVGLGAGCFGLLAAGARAVVGAHHATKASKDQSYMTLENMLRGAGDLGAFVRVAYGLRKVSKNEDLTSARVLMACIKPGDFDPPEPFELEGRPYINQGRGMQMATKPGQVNPARLAAVLREEKNKAGRKPDPLKALRDAEIAKLLAADKSKTEIAAAVAAGAEAKKWPAIFTKTLENAIQEIRRKQRLGG